MELTINIKIRKDRLVDVLLDGYNDSDTIMVSVGSAFNPCIVDDEGYLVITSNDDDASAEVKITIGELGVDIIFVLAELAMKYLQAEKDRDKMGKFLGDMISSFIGFTSPEANELIIKILEMVE